MIGQLLADTTPGTHPTITICGGGGFLCTYDEDTVISSAIAVAVTLAIGFLLVRTLRSGKPGRLQMVFELFLSYVRNLIRETVGEEVPAFLLPLAATIGFFILVANWLDFFPLQQPVEPANADLNLPLAMGLIVFLMSQGYAIRVRGLGGYFHHYLCPPYRRHDDPADRRHRRRPQHRSVAGFHLRWTALARPRLGRGVQTVRPPRPASRCSPSDLRKGPRLPRFHRSSGRR